MENKGKTPGIVLVDDEHDILDILQEQLQIRGYNVVGTATNGKEAVETYFQLRPDVVILDIMMPKFDGFYALEKIKMDNQGAKVIVITADFTQETKEKLKENNVDIVLFKPYKIDHVVKAIKDLTDLENINLTDNPQIPFS